MSRIRSSRIWRRARAALGAVKKAPPRTTDLEVTLDNGSLLNWRSQDPVVDAAILIAADGSHRIEIPALEEPGPRRGALEISQLRGRGYDVGARTGAQEITALSRAAPPRPMTRNEATVAEGVWIAQAKDRAWSLVLEAIPVGIRTISLGQGMLRLEVGPVESAPQLVLRERGSSAQVLVSPRQVCGTSAQFALGTSVWSRLDPQSLAPWDVWISLGGSVQRLGWTGSALASPRDGLRMRAKNALLADGRKLRVRPYWTKDQLLALEIQHPNHDEKDNS